MAPPTPGPLTRGSLRLITVRRRRLDDEGELVLHVAFGRLPNAVRLVRRTATEVAAHLGYLEQLDDVRLLTSELSTNALRHSHGDITLTVRRRSDAALFLAVGDESPHFPRRRTAALHDERGRGLELLHCLAADWGIASTGQGSKYVWCLLHTPTQPPELSSPPPTRETPA